MAMRASDTSSVRPTPEAILGVLGKLRRTLSKNVAEPGQAQDSSGLIKATDAPDSSPNLLRPSPGLMSMPNKQGLPSERSLNMAGLESAAPPVELDRPQKLQIEETALPIAALPETAQPTTDLPQTAPLETALPALVVPGSAPFVPALSSPEGVKNADSTDPQVSVTQLSSSRQSYAPAAAAVANAADQSSPGSGAPMSQPVASFSINAVSDTARPAEELDSSAATTNQESRKTEVAESRQAAAAATSGDNATHGSSQAAGGVSLGSQVVSPDLEPVSYTPVLVDKEGDEQTATLDQDLDAVIEELSLELSHLQPAGGAEHAQQGSYLQRHTSSVVLKIVQEASNPPLPAVATMAQAKADGPAQPASPRQARKPAEAQQAKHALQNMAASLKRAYDEGRLRERKPAPATAVEDEQAGNEAGVATLRTFRPSAKAMKDYNPPVTQHNPSPNLAATSSSYAALKASMRRSISPKAAARALPLNKRPAWDATPPPRRSPQHAQHELQDSSSNCIAEAKLLSQLSNASAQQAPREVEQIGTLQVSSERPKPLSSAESAALAVAALLNRGQSASPVRHTASAIRQTQISPRLGLQPLHSSADAVTSLNVPYAVPSDDTAATSSSQARLRGTASTRAPQNPSKSNPSSNSTDQELLQPAWVSPSRHRLSSFTRQPSPLQRTTGSRTLTPPKATAGQAAATAQEHVPHHAAHAAHAVSSRDFATSQPSHDDFKPQTVALQSDAAQLDACSPSLLANPQGNTQRLAHAQALQRLHQAVQNYKHPAQGLGASQGLQDSVQSDPEALQSDAAQLDARSPSLIANVQADSHRVAHAQALQRLQQAVQEYKSSSANVLVPAAVQLAAALRRASRASGEPMPTIESLQLAGLKLKHESALDSTEEVPKSPWPDWVRGAWGSPTAQKRDRSNIPMSGGKKFEPAQQAQHAAAAFKSAPAQAKHDVRNNKAQQAASGQFGSGSLPKADQQPPTASWSPVQAPVSQPTRRSTLVQRALSEAAAAAAAARAAPSPRARATTTPPRRATAKQHSQSPQQTLQKNVTPRQSSSAPRAVRGDQGRVRPAVPVAKAQVGRQKGAVQKSRPTGKARTGQQSLKLEPSKAEFQTQAGAPVPAVHAVPEPAAMPSELQPEAAESRAVVSAVHETTASDAHTVTDQAVAEEAHVPANHATASGSDAPQQIEQTSLPAHSSTSVAALRKTFEQKASHVESTKPRNRLPLRKVSSKAHTIAVDSPQEAALAWQLSLRDVDEIDSSPHPHPHALHAVQCPEPVRAEQSEHTRHRNDMSAGGNHSAAARSSPGLIHTMSALVSQREDLNSTVASQQADQTAKQSAAQQAACLYLTESTLAAANAARSSAEKLPISHRLTVTRSTFDSDQGSLVSMESVMDEVGDEPGNIRVNRPTGIVSHPLAAEATFALLPDRGMSPVSESAEEGPFTEGRAVSWRGLRWAHGPSWVRVVCRLAPSPTPHFVHPQGPHILQANLGRHGADTKQFSFDQVLSEDSIPEEVAGEAEGLLEAVLQGRNSVVLALGQSGSGKTHTMAGDISPLDRTRTRITGLGQHLVEKLFSYIDEGSVTAQVHSVHMTAFQIQDEKIQDLMQPPPVSKNARQLRRTGSTADKHDVFVDKEKRTWVSNLAAIQIMSPTDFNDMAELIASHRSSSSAAHSMSHGPGSCIITLLVTADLPSVSVSHGSLPSSARGQKRNSPRAAAAASNSAVASDLGLQRGSLIGHASVQRGDKTHNVHGTTQSCIKLSFVEVGCAAPETRQAARRASAEPLQHMQLSRTSTSLSSFVSMSSTTSSRWAGPGSGTSPRRVGMGAGKGQDGTMRAVAEVVWAAAHAKGVPVPHRQCKLTRYLQDTLHPEGRAVAIVCLDPSAGDPAQSASMATLSISERMMLP